MQVITGYLDSQNIKNTQRLRLYHLNRPAVKKWRATRHNKSFVLDTVDYWIVDQLRPAQLTTVDCAGWYFNDYGIQTTCLEGDMYSKKYYPACHIEYDIETHCPTYISRQHPVLFKYPWFLKYIKFNKFIEFLQVWSVSELIINFDPVLVQHNHLKFNLQELTRKSINVNINTIAKNLWLITR
jgi:hypothetical protein